MSKYFIILGPPGSGKGTQAKRIAKKLGYFYFGTGDLMREEIDKRTLYGLEFKKAIESGKLVKDDVVAKFVGQKLKDLNITEGIIFDGYPRTITQAEYLNNILEEKEINNLKVINLVTSPKSLVHRMLKRSIEEKRVDDKPEVINNRIKVYEKQTKPLLEYYKEQGNLINIDGEPSIDKVWEKTQQILDDYN